MYSYKKRTGKVKKFFLLIFLMAVVSVVSIYLYDMYINIKIPQHTQATDGMAIKLSNLKNEEQKTEEVTTTLEEATRCVVGISKIKNVGESILSPNSTSELGMGTGIIVSENGYILTNWHVAGNKYNTCYVTLENGEIYNGNVVWADSDLDLAMIKINITGLNYLTIGDSDNIKLGENVYAIGNPIGIEFQRTVTSGIISGINRTIKVQDENGESYMEDLIQTDASINTGNSGGPLINGKGEIIGVNSIKITSAEGIGFAIPINIIKPVIESFVNNDKFEEAYVGIFAYDKEVIPYLNSNIEFESGIYVVKIATDGPAINSGLKIGDIITKIDNNQINKMSEFRKNIYRKKAGDEINLTINRNNQEYSITVKLGRR